MPATAVTFTQLLGVAITSTLLESRLQVALSANASWMHALLSPSYSPSLAPSPHLSALFF